MKKKIQILVFFILMCATFSFLNAQQTLKGSSNDSPIEIFAEDGIEWHKNKNKYIARGNAKAKKGDLLVKSKILEATYGDSEGDEENSEIELIKAIGNVFIENNNATITGGEKASFNVEKEHFIVNGKQLILISNKDKLKSNRTIEFWKIENIAIATGKAEAFKDKKYTIKADKLVWHLTDSKKKKEYEIKKILAFKNVIIETNNEIAYSDKALYNELSGICKLFGNVKLRKGESYLTGEYAEMNLNSGISKLLPHPKNDSFGNEGRVKALIKKNEQ